MTTKTKRQTTSNRASARAKDAPAQQRRGASVGAVTTLHPALRARRAGRSAPLSGDSAGTLDETVEKLQQSEAMVRTLFRISKKLNATLNVGSLLDDLAQEAIQIVGGESGFAGLCTADGMTVHKYFRRGQAIPFDYT